MRRPTLSASLAYKHSAARGAGTACGSVRRSKCRALLSRAHDPGRFADPAGVLANVTMDQPCGGYVTAAGEHLSYLTSEGVLSREKPKGFICGPPSVCIETGNPANGAWSFDNIFTALMQVSLPHILVCSFPAPPCSPV